MVSYNERDPDDRALEPIVITDLPNGTAVIECRFCEGSGLFPSTMNGPDIETDPCPVCKGIGANLVPGNQDTWLGCRYCGGTGRGWDREGMFYGETCRVCGGRGMNDLASLTGGRPGEFSFWSLLHPDIVTVARSRFDAGHFADSVEAALKQFNERVKTMAGDTVAPAADGAGLMTQVFSERDPILILDDLTTRSGKDVQIGYMQMFAGAMTGVRNPKAHANITIDATRAIHFLYIASLFMFKLDGARKSPSRPSA